MSLLDVLERHSFSFYEMILHAQRLRTYVGIYGSTEVLFSESRDEFPAFLAELKAECDALGFSHTRGLATHAESRLAHRGKKYRHTELLSDLETLIFSFGNELQTELFVRVLPEKGRYFQQAALFGTEVAAAFPSSAHDIQHAGTCFALSQNDACVFHLMRVLERGLNVVAGRVDVSFDRQNWQDVINRIEAALKRPARSTDVDLQERKLLAQAATHLYFVKGAWRNDVIHGRELCDTGKAMSVLANVTEFMQALAAAGFSEPPEQD